MDTFRDRDARHRSGEMARERDANGKIPTFTSQPSKRNEIESRSHL